MGTGVNMFGMTGPGFPAQQLNRYQIALVRTGDGVKIDCMAGTIDLLLTEAELAARGAAHVPRAPERLAGVMEKYAKLVGPARQGATTHSGAAEWPRQ